MNLEKDEGSYIEPNVWMRHDLRRTDESTKRNDEAIVPNVERIEQETQEHIAVMAK